MKNLILGLTLLVSFQSFASSEAFLRVDKKKFKSSSERYSFSLCMEIDNCQSIGRKRGYLLKEIKGLSGAAQKYIGAPVLVITETVAGVGAAFVIGSVAVPAASASAVAGILWGGAAAGAVGTSVISSVSEHSSQLRKISPSYHWKKGNTKMDIESAVRSLAKSPKARTAILYHSKNFKSLNKFLITTDIVERILIDL